MLMNAEILGRVCFLVDISFILMLSNNAWTDTLQRSVLAICYMKLKHFFVDRCFQLVKIKVVNLSNNQRNSFRITLRKRNKCKIIIYMDIVFIIIISL